MAKYPILTDEMFRDMMQSDKVIREARYFLNCDDVISEC